MTVFLSSRRIEALLIGVPVFVYLFLFLSLSLLRHFSLHSTYLDLGLESQVIYNSAHGRFFETSFGEKGQLISAFSFHVSPISLLFVPIYLIFPDPVILLISQTLFLALGALPVFYLALHLIRSRFLALSFLVSYLLYPALEYSNLSDFHPQTLATPLLLFSLYFLFRKRWRPFYLFVLLSLAVKENVSLVIFLLSLFMIFRLKIRLPGLIVLLGSLAWFVFAVFVILPTFSGNSQAAFSRYQYLGGSIPEIFQNVVLHPAQTLRILLVRPKLIYLIHLAASVGFLPLAGLPMLFPSLGEFFVNLFSSYNPQWQVKFHYTAAITAFVFPSAIFGAVWLQKRFGHSVANLEKKLGVYLLSISLLWNILHSPSPLNFKFDPSPYVVSAEAREKLMILRTLPESASVSAMNNLGAHLSNRRFIYRFPINYSKADYVVVDPGLPSRSFDLSQIDPGTFAGYLEELKKDRNYKVKYNLSHLLVFERVKL